MNCTAAMQESGRRPSPSTRVREPRDLGFRAETDVLFDCLPAREVCWGSGTNRALHDGLAAITDANGHVYPSCWTPARAGFLLHPQVYRADNEGAPPSGRFGTRSPSSAVRSRFSKTRINGRPRSEPLGLPGRAMD